MPWLISPIRFAPAAFFILDDVSVAKLKRILRQLWSGYKTGTMFVKPDTVAGLRGGDWAAAFGRIQSKHVDFLVVEVATTEIACVVELDDRSHQREKRKARDAFVDESLESCAVPVFRVPVRVSYDPATVRAGLHCCISRGVILRRRMKSP